MRLEPLHKILIAGFAAVVITLIVCTFVLNQALMKVYRAQDNSDVVSAVELEGGKLRTLLGEKIYSHDIEEPWIPPSK